MDKTASIRSWGIRAAIMTYDATNFQNGVADALIVNAATPSPADQTGSPAPRQDAHASGRGGSPRRPGRSSWDHAEGRRLSTTLNLGPQAGGTVADVKLYNANIGPGDLDAASSVVELRERAHYEYDEFFPGPYSTDTMQQVYASYPGPTDGTQEIAVPEWAGFRRDAAWSFTTTLAFGDGGAGAASSASFPYELAEIFSPTAGYDAPVSPIDAVTLGAWHGFQPDKDWAIKISVDPVTSGGTPPWFHQTLWAFTHANGFASLRRFDNFGLVFRWTADDDATALSIGYKTGTAKLTDVDDFEFAIVYDSSNYVPGGGTSPDFADITFFLKPAGSTWTEIPKAAETYDNAATDDHMFLYYPPYDNFDGTSTIAGLPLAK